MYFEPEEETDRQKHSLLSNCLVRRAFLCLSVFQCRKINKRAFLKLCSKSVMKQLHLKSGLVKSQIIKFTTVSNLVLLTVRADY